MDTDASSTTRIAVLIDCDNVSARHIGAVLEELASYGVPTVKRAYGDWTTTQLTSWKPELLRNAIQPIQQFAHTVGKNSTDSALIIDAMDLLWLGNVEAFAIVSSDSDFTRLATRLRESGKRVFGLGRRKTPESLRRAVDQFIFLEVLQDQDRRDEEQAAGAGEGSTVQDDSTSTEDGSASTAVNLQSALTKAVNATSGDDGWSRLSQVGQHLSRAHADFDPREFGHQKLGSLVDEQPYLETRAEGSGVQVRLRQKRTTRRTTKSAATKTKPAAEPATKAATKAEPTTKAATKTEPSAKAATKAATKAPPRKTTAKRTAKKATPRTQEPVPAPEDDPTPPPATGREEPRTGGATEPKSRRATRGPSAP